MLKTLKPLLSALGILAVAAPLAAQGAYGPGYGHNALRFRLGLFQPDGDSRYWNDKKVDFTGDASDFEDLIVGVDYKRRVSDHLAILVSGSGYQGDTDQAYRNFTDGFGNDIVHNTTLEIDTLTGGLMFELFPDRTLNPYVGAGAGAYFWRLEESGDFIDFFVTPNEIFTTRFRDDGVTLGYFWLAGLEVRVSPSWAVFAEGRWHRAKDDLAGDFSTLGKLDLSGREVSGGVTWRF